MGAWADLKFNFIISYCIISKQNSAMQCTPHLTIQWFLIQKGILILTLIKKNLANVIQVYYPLISNNNKITKFYQWSIPHFKQMKRCICGKKAFKLYHELQPNELVEAIQSLSVALPYTLVYLFEMATLREIFATHPKKSLFKISNRTQNDAHFVHRSRMNPGSLERILFSRSSFPA